MENIDFFNQMIEEAKAIPADQIKSPFIPIGIYIQESEDLVVWASHDKDSLTENGLPESVFKRQNLCAGALRQAESEWAEELKAKQEAEVKWLEESPKAFNFRNDLLRSFRYAYRKEPSLLTNVAAIAEGDDIPDMIQDLNDLSVLGLHNIEPLRKIGFAEEKLGTAAELSAKMADLRAQANGEKYGTSEKLEMRNRMYTLLKECVDEIRECGKYVFWNDSKRLIGYRSQFLKNKNDHYRNNN